jgi:ribosomal-protein-alanine N-acetyltransferase
MKVAPRLVIEPMRHSDITAVQAIEHEIFPSPWPRNAYATELSQNRQAHYFVLRDGPTVIGYGGLWKVANEAHITTIGVRSRSQGQGYGTALFAALIQRSYELGARWVTLEVRAGNAHAIRLYGRFGFRPIGRRRGYYSDNGEDAVVMWSDSLHAPSFKRRFVDILVGIDVVGVGTPPTSEYPRW